MPEARYEEILHAVEDSIATITLNRPEKLNAYTPEMGEEVVDAFRRIREDDDIRAVILTGAGRGFCAGVDLEALKRSQSGHDAKIKLGEEDFIRKLPLELWDYPKPVIVAINGAAIGVGATMTLPCDMRLASEDAKIAFPFTKLGILPGLGSSHLLPQLVGMGRALELILSGRTFSGLEAAGMGLVQRALPGQEVMEEARCFAGLMASAKPAVLRAARRALRMGPGLSLAGAMENEQALSAELRKTRPPR
jgi:enoyl-CoA hydratase/carnithine racemase